LLVRLVKVLTYHGQLPFLKVIQQSFKYMLWMFYIKGYVPLYLISSTGISTAVLEMKIWIYWSKSNSWIYFYMVFHKNWKKILVLRNTGVLFIHVKFSKISYTVTLSKVRYIQDSILFRIPFGHVLLYISSFQKHYIICWYIFHYHIYWKIHSKKFNIIFHRIKKRKDNLNTAFLYDFGGILCLLVEEIHVLKKYFLICI
jgi:hypothetical protein